MTRLPVRILEGLGDKSGQEVSTFVTAQLAAVSSPDSEFRRRLSGPIYDENAAVARFVLSALAEDSMTRETFTDLWARQGEKWVWTIEHIFPQGQNIPEPWVQMMAGGDSTLALDLQERHVHKLGNLTITGYNSALSNASFEHKRDRMDGNSYVGYKNGLGLNADLCNAEAWSIEQIEQRGTRLVEQALRLFALPVPE